jgi:hypothetical protein
MPSHTTASEIIGIQDHRKQLGVQSAKLQSTHRLPLLPDSVQLVSLNADVVFRKAQPVLAAA